MWPKKVKPPVEFGERTQDCSLGPAGKEGPHLVMMGESRGFSRAAMQRMGFPSSYDGELWEPLLWRQGSQVSMRVARGSASLLLSHGRGIAPQDALKKDSRGLLRVGAGNPCFPRLVPVISGRYKGASEKSGILCSWEGPLGTPLGSVQWKRASSRVEAGNSCFLS